MYIVDSLPAAYYEEREAAEAAKRQDRIREQRSQLQQSALIASQTNPQRPSQSCFPQSSLPRPASTSVLGNIFQGFVRAANQSPSPPPGPEKFSRSGTTTPVSTPPAKVMTQEEVEALMAEKRRDADIVGFRAW